ncbi:MAG: trypsin-like serine peptidase, partial [Saprospiraceae bacterium]
SSDDSHLYYSLDTKGGQSGSPIFTLSDGIPSVIAIHISGKYERDENGQLIKNNSAVRINDRIMQRIVEWQNL